MGQRRDLDNLIDESRASQWNIVFPDTVRNGRAVDVFLWRGSPNPLLVQRIGAWMFGLLFIGSGLLLFSVAAPMVIEEDHSWIGVAVIALISLSFVLIGMRIFRNGFPRRIKGGEVK